MTSGAEYVTRAELAHAIEAAIGSAMEKIMARIEARRIGPGTWISAVIGCVAVVMSFAAMMGGLVLFAIVGLTGPMQSDIAHNREVTAALSQKSEATAANRFTRQDGDQLESRVRNLEIRMGPTP